MKKKTKSSKEVAVKASQEVRPTWNEEQIQLIKNTVAKNATDDELKLFLYTAGRTGLDPLTKQIHFVKRGNNMTIQTGIDGYRAIAERTGQLAGIDDAVYEEGSTGLPLKATVTVYRIVKGLRVGFTASARWNEYVPQGGQSFMYQKMPFLMLGKVAEALALRKAFPLNLSGLYTNEEMEQAQSPISTTNSSPQTAQSLPEADKKVTQPKKVDAITKVKISIQKSLLIIDGEVNPENVHATVKELTGLDLVEENYSEIDARLAAIVAARAETK